MKRNWKKAILSSVLLLCGFGLVSHSLETRLHAQTAEVRSSPEALSPEKNQQEIDENDAYRHSAMVAKIGRMMGMSTNEAATVFEVGNFVILAAVVLWGMAKVLPKFIQGRNSAIRKDLVDARTATEEARARLGSVEERLAKLDGEIAAMRAHAEQDALKEEQRIKVAVEDEKKKIVAAAEQEIAAATMHAQKQLQQHAAELAIEQAARKLVVTAETDRLLVQNFAQRLAGDESKKRQN